LARTKLICAILNAEKAAEKVWGVVEQV
jgi:hypothetical protein